MNLQYVKAKREDANKLIEIYNLSFYDDYVKYGECPAYGRTRQSMEESIEKFEKHIIQYEDKSVGVISIENKGNGEYYLGCLCVIPQYQGSGIGTKTVQYILDYYTDWSIITLVTPEDKVENMDFYKKKCGFTVVGTSVDGNVKVAHLQLKRNAK